ncbi:MAG: RES family NAD+ phosphorylase [Gemmatimonadaceae bacterium]
MRLWRLVKTRYAATAFDGEGARLHGARWNGVGVRVAYAADSSALAVLEVLVHLGKVSVLPSYSLVTGNLPSSLMEDLEESTLPAGWNASPVPPAVQSMGDAWIRSGRSLALRVPSAIVQGSYSVLINPAHPDVGQFIVDAATPYSFDARLIKIPGV